MTEKHVNTWSSWFDSGKVTVDFMSDREQDLLLAENLELFMHTENFEKENAIADKDRLDACNKSDAA
ncbi:hypothetical protein [Limnobacter parvus]|uniref:Uncharacterized protein n=1 Tax=Limnobacter parvus TaxID=2939690 RepID=A0ABT1XDA5_9BURK|nr:hypothetical protein [Limnobacter parvus]MCR2745256.1 hypothetical protein [Limnobacter parvus]